MSCSRMVPRRRRSGIVTVRTTHHMDAVHNPMPAAGAPVDIPALDPALLNILGASGEQPRCTLSPSHQPTLVQDALPSPTLINKVQTPAGIAPHFTSSMAGGPSMKPVYDRILLVDDEAGLGEDAQAEGIGPSRLRILRHTPNSHGPRGYRCCF